MSTQPYTEEELRKYFEDPAHRHRHRQRGGGNGQPVPNQARNAPRMRRAYRGYRGFLHRRFHDPKKAEAAFVLSTLASVGLVSVLGLLLYMLILSGAGITPSLDQIENPNLDLATVAYTADGVELGRFGRENRSWIAYENISEHVVHALVATEDHRFYQHWGIDLFRTVSAVSQTVLGKLGIPGFYTQGGSTITQQLARNLYNEQIGFDRSVTRKLKEMITAVQLERRYTKQEIIEMYLNTVPFRHNAYGIEAASRTYFGKSAKDLDVLESAALVGMLKANTRYDPVRNPERSRQRRNVVMQQMIKNGLLDEAFYTTYRDSLTATDFRSADVTDSFAPYFAEYVRNWLADWGEQNGHDIYAEGLVAYTTLDSRLQAFAAAAVEEQMNGLQAVVDCEWSRPSNPLLGQATKPYLDAECDPFAYYWKANKDIVDSFIRESYRFRQLRDQGTPANEAVAQLRRDEAFMDSLKAEKTRLEAGIVSIDPRTGYIKAWVGGRNLKSDWYDHVAIAKRQPGSTFKPFVYTAAIDNGYMPNYMLPDSVLIYEDPYTGDIWQPGNSGAEITGRMMEIREGLARSLNTITGRLILEITPHQAAFYARRMGIQSELDEVPSLALGTSDVTLLELTTGYTTLANGGLRNDPVVVTSIVDKNGNVLYEAQAAPKEALSEETTALVIDMMRDVVGYGTGVRIRGQFGLGEYDLAGKTGTTQESADGWFMLMHPDLVTGAWVGFNDRRVTFRSNWWGQGAHNALFIVGDYITRTNTSSEVALNKEARFPTPEDFGITLYPNDVLEFERGRDAAKDRNRVGW
ncbi:MAG: penicillin-binding protein 1A [Rhodothermales bacterium]